MAWSFNVFTGNLDQTGSGAVVFEGEVATFADLPVTVGDPAVGSSYLVRESTGVWLVNRKQAGIWIRSNNTGVRDTDWTYGGDYPVNSVNGKTGNVSLGKSDVGLGNVDNTSDANKPISTATQTAIDGKAASVHTHTASQISDSTATGRSLLTATDAAAARSAISAQVAGSYAASAHTHPSTDITGLAASATTDTTNAANISSGVLANARVNFAAPAAIGSTTPAAVSATDLSASNRLNIPNTNGTTAGDIYRNANTLRYRDSTNTERLLLNASDNLANLSSASTARTNLGVGGSDAVTFGSIQGTPIGSTTASTGAFSTLSATPAAGSTALTLTGGTVTASVPVMSVTQTWNNAAGSFTTAEMRTSVTAGNGYLFRIFAGSTGTTERFRVAADGEVNAGVTLTVAGPSGGIASPNFSIGNSNHWRSGSNGALVWTDTANNAYAGTNDLFVLRDAAGTLAQRNAANAQTFRLYNTFTDASNFERGFIGWSSNTLRIGTEKGGTGSARALEFQTDGTSRLTISTAGVFQFGGTTSSFPALKRSSTALQVRLADDSAFAPFDAGNISATGSVTATSFIRANGFQCSTGSAGITFGDGFTSIVGPSTAGVLRIQAFNNTDVLIGIGGNTSSWPALNSSGSTLRIRLADNSGFAPLSCGGLTLNGNLDASTRNIVTDTTTGTRIGTGTTQLLGFWNATPATQPASVADATDAATVITQLNALLSRLRTIGIIAT